MERVSGTLQKTCTDVANLSRAVEKDNVFDGVASNAKGPAKNRSIVAIKQEQAEKRKMLQRAEQEASMLPDFIRCVPWV